MQDGYCQELDRSFLARCASRKVWGGERKARYLMGAGVGGDVIVRSDREKEQRECKYSVACRHECEICYQDGWCSVSPDMV